MRVMKILVVIGVACMLSACVGSVKELNVADASPDTGFLILDMDATFDGYRAEGKALSTSCILGANSPSTVNADTNTKVSDVDIVALGDTYHFRILSTKKPGRYAFDTVSCIAYKVLWNKARKKYVNPPLIVDIKPGTITYPGTLVMDWESAGFGGLDLINMGGGLDEDDGALVLKRADRSADIKSKLEQQNPELMKKFKFETTGFEPNPRIVQ